MSKMSKKPFDIETAPLDSGTVVLEASAGTGKTYAVVGMLMRMLLERRIESLDQALVVTFTTAATAELKNRLRRALLDTLGAVRNGHADSFYRQLAKLPDAESLIRTALDNFDEVPIATIHGFCKRLLDEAAFESREPFALDFAVDPLPMLHSAAADVLRGCYTTGASVQGAVLHRSELDPEQLVRLYSLWQRYPEVTFEPEDPAASDHLERLEAAMANAIAQLDADACERIEGFKWKVGKGLAKVAERLSIARLAERMASDPRLALPELCILAQSSMVGRLYKRPPPRLDHPFFAACDEVLEAADQAGAHLRAELLHRMHDQLEADKRKVHVISYQDLLTRTHAALRDPERRTAMLGAIRSRYRVALIDEFQDTDKLQYEIFADCFAERPLFLIGDPKQSIYGFRGADLEAYLAACKDAAEKFTLGTNWRSADGLVRAVQKTCEKPGAFVLDGIDLPEVEAKATPTALGITGDDGAPLQWRYLTSDHVESKDGLIRKADAEDRIARDVAAEISRLLSCDLHLDTAPLRPRDIAVLTRTNWQAVAVQGQLRDAGIVSAIGKAGDVLDTEEIEELERLLRAILQPRNLMLCRAAMATRIFGFDAERLVALESDEGTFDRELLRFEGWRQTWVRRGFVVMKEQILTDLGLEPRYLATRGGERQLTNLQQLCEILHRAEHENRLSPEGLLEFLQHERLHREEIDYQLRELRLESDDDAVKILTVHGSKGLEYEIVFCPFLWDGRTPPRQAIVPREETRELVFELTSQHEQFLAADRERLAEDARLVYVALSRAKRRCYVHVGPVGYQGAGAHRSALCWMLDPLAADQPLNRAGKTGYQWYEDWVQRHKDPATIRPLVERLVAASDGLMSLCDIDRTPQAELLSVTTQATLGPTRRAVRKPRSRGLHSFSSLTAGATPEPAARDVADPTVSRAASAERTGIFAFARGPAAGNCLHAILEHVSWDRLGDSATGDSATGDNSTGDSATKDLVAGKLRDCGLIEPTAHGAEIDPVAVVTANLHDLAGALAGPDGPPLGTLCRPPSSPEMAFVLPTDDCATETLAAMFAASTSAPARRYSDRLAALPRSTLRGFLVGFIDLIAEHEGRYWVLDWKSNHLGDDVACYGSEALADVMHDHDYVLQYHLYVLALHRHLRARLADYDYDRDCGGVCYVFLRGAQPGSQNGMFFDKPPLELVLGMDAWARGAAVGEPS